MSSKIENFIHIKDFYNFIKKDTGENSPTTFYYFSVNFFPAKNISNNLQTANVTKR